MSNPVAGFGDWMGGLLFAVIIVFVGALVLIVTISTTAESIHRDSITHIIEPILPPKPQPMKLPNPYQYWSHNRSLLPPKQPGPHADRIYVDTFGRGIPADADGRAAYDIPLRKLDNGQFVLDIIYYEHGAKHEELRPVRNVK